MFQTIPIALPVLSEFDLYLFGEGNHYHLYDKLGAHVIEHGGRAGVLFAVWAPNAQRVSVVGDFNHWDGRRAPHAPARRAPGCGSFHAGPGRGDLYKYEIKSQLRPAAGHEGRPVRLLHGSCGPEPPRVCGDMTPLPVAGPGVDGRPAHSARPSTRPSTIYEVHLGSWRRVGPEGNRWLTYRELADAARPYVKRMGFTHIELLPITEHPFDGSWGYQVDRLFRRRPAASAPRGLSCTSSITATRTASASSWTGCRRISPRMHTAWAIFDGTHLYEHADPRMGEHPDWGTLIFNYGRNEVRNFLLTNALFWLDKYHIDGLRVDAVASMLYLDYSRKPGEWMPNEYGGNENLEAIAFLQRFNELVHASIPGVLTIAEESTAWPMVSRPTYLGGLGFSLKWNMGWMHDTLDYMSKDPIYRSYHHNSLTFSLIYAFSENFVLPFSHDEVVHLQRLAAEQDAGRRLAAVRQPARALRLHVAHPARSCCSWAASSASGTNGTTKATRLESAGLRPHRQLQHYVRDLNTFLREPALHEVDF